MPEKILVIFAHPLLEKSRVNKQLIKFYRERGNVSLQDLYEQYPDFNIDVEYQKQLLTDHNLIILHHPLYWYSCPPIMKQWIDMVLEVGWAYGPGGDALKGKQMMQVITSGARKAAYTESGRNHHSLREFLLPFEQTAMLCGMTYLPPYVIHGTHRLSNEDIRTYSQELSALLDLLSAGVPSGDATSGADYFNELLTEDDGI